MVGLLGWLEDIVDYFDSISGVSFGGVSGWGYYLVVYSGYLVL